MKLRDLLAVIYSTTDITITRDYDEYWSGLAKDIPGELLSEEVYEIGIKDTAELLIEIY